jgi:DNA-binding NarL/FixJ family response regulator
LPERWRVDRARIILACAEGMSNAGAAQALGIAVKSVSKWRRQFAFRLVCSEVGDERTQLAWHGPNHSPDNIFIYP